MRVNEYKVVFNVEGQPFDELVTECLNDGWNLHGNPWAHQESGSDIVTLYQAITRESNIVLMKVALRKAKKAKDATAAYQNTELMAQGPQGMAA